MSNRFDCKLSKEKWTRRNKHDGRKGSQGRSKGRKRQNIRNNIRTFHSSNCITNSKENWGKKIIFWWKAWRKTSTKKKTWSQLRIKVELHIFNVNMLWLKIIIFARFTIHKVKKWNIYETRKKVFSALKVS